MIFWGWGRRNKKVEFMVKSLVLDIGSGVLSGFYNLSWSFFYL